MSLSEHQAVLAVVNQYLTGAYEGDAEKIAAAFHPKATMCGFLFGQEVLSTPEFYLSEVRKNPSPKSSGEVVQSVVSHVEVHGPVASVTLNLSGYWGSDGTDYLQLIKGEAGWKIINKTFWFRPRD